jgi:hypothetical protein
VLATLSRRFRKHYEDRLVGLYAARMIHANRVRRERNRGNTLL